MNIFDYFKKKGIDTVDPTFYRKIAEWESWYHSNVKKFHAYRIYNGRGGYVRCRRKSLGMGKMMSEDIANLMLNERVKFVIGDAGEDGSISNAFANADYDFVKSVLNANRWWKLGNEYQERKAATGTVAYVPYIDNGIVDADGRFIDGQIKINYVEAKNIFPLSWENGRVIDCVFESVKTYSRKTYAHLQFHKLIQSVNDAGEPFSEYVIENTVVECTSGAGKELTEGEWKQITPFSRLAPVIHTGSDKPQFVIDTLNITNNADDDSTNPMGVSIFANAIDVLESLDLKYDSYANEFVLGRKRILVAPEMLSNADGNPTFDPSDAVFYQLPEDYFAQSGKEPIHELNMDLRVEAHSKAIQDDLNYLSVKCGFGSEHYRFEGGQVKTATEVVSENSDMYRTLRKHELVLNEALQELIHIIIRLGIAIGVPQLSEDVNITIDFDDSIIEDKDAERRRDREDVSMGVMSLAEYRAKWYGETEEQAQQRIPEQISSVID